MCSGPRSCAWSMSSSPRNAPRSKRMRLPAIPDRHGRGYESMDWQQDASPTGSAPDAAPRHRPRRTSHLLRDFVTSHPEPRISLGALRDALGDRGFGVLLFIFALPNLVPVNIPLLSAVLGLPLVLLAAQLTYGRHKPWFPRWLTE